MERNVHGTLSVNVAYSLYVGVGLSPAARERCFGFSKTSVADDPRPQLLNGRNGRASARPGPRGATLAGCRLPAAVVEVLRGRRLVENRPSRNCRSTMSLKQHSLKSFPSRHQPLTFGEYSNLPAAARTLWNITSAKKSPSGPQPAKGGKRDPEGAAPKPAASTAPGEPGAGGNEAEEEATTARAKSEESDNTRRPAEATAAQRTASEQQSNHQPFRRRARQRAADTGGAGEKQGREAPPEKKLCSIRFFFWRL